jgi:BTB And C-terminal Kelch
MGSPLSCDLNQFQAIFQNLSLYPSSDHERIEIVHGKSGYYPITKKKELFLTSTDFKTAEWALSFFEANLANLSETTKPSSFLSKFVIIFQSEPLIQRFSQLCGELFYKDTIRATKQIRKAMIQDAQIECDVVKKELTLLRETNQTRCDAIKKEIAVLHATKIELRNTLLVCQEGQKIHEHFINLKKILFFESYSNCGMKKIVSVITDEEKQKYPHIFDFTDFSLRTIQFFLDWLRNPKTLTKICKFEDLYEIYRLADFVRDGEFQLSCIKRFIETLDDEKIFKILSCAEYFTSDPLIQHCCKYVANQFKLLAKTESFLKTKHEYLIEILKSDTIYLEEIEIFNAVLKWAHAHQENKTVKQILNMVVEGRTLIECIRFQYIPKSEFILYKELFSDQAREEWYEFYLRNKVMSYLRCAPTGFFSQFDGKQMEIQWAVPMEDYEMMKTKSAGELEGISFPFKNDSGKVKLCMSTKFRSNLSIQVTFPQGDFDFFVQISGLRNYNCSNSATVKNSNWKVVYFTFDELEKNVDMNQDFVLIKLLIFLK